MGSLVAQTKGIDELLETLRKSPAAKTLTVWGLSLNWAKNIPLALAKLTRKELVIRIFVPTDDVITNAFVIDAPEEHVDATFLFSSARAASIGFLPMSSSTSDPMTTARSAATPMGNNVWTSLFFTRLHLEPHRSCTNRAPRA